MTTNETTRPKITRAKQAYPLPFFDLSQLRMPKSIRDIYKWCLYYYISTPLIPAVVNKLSTYPITSPIISTEDQVVKDRWEKLLIENLNIQFILAEMNLDWCLFGNSFAAVYVPFKRFLGCKECGLKMPMNGSDWRVKFKKEGPEFRHKCDACGKIVNSDIYDKTLPSPDGINIIRYDPTHIRVVKDLATGKLKYLWKIPAEYRSLIMGNDHPELIEDAPYEVLTAIASGKDMLLESKNIFHMKRPTPSGSYHGLGLPLIIHALKWTYYLHVLQSAQEAIAEDKLVPTDFIFPQSSSGNAVPSSGALSFNKFMRVVEDGLAKKAKDPNHKILVPSPVGVSRVGGDGRALLLSQEIEWVSKQIISSMGVPIEFVYGGLTWTGSSITLRMLENSLIGMRDQADRFLKFVVNRAALALNWAVPEVKLSDLKMADDIQRQQLAMQLEASRKISTTTLLNEFDYDIHAEHELKKDEYFMFMADMIKDTVSNARAQGEAGVVANNYAMRSQLIQEQQSAEMQQSQPQVDPNTGLPIDPNTGLPVDENGQYYDPQTGQPLTPEQAEEVMQMQQTEQQSQQPQGEQPTQGNTEGPGSAVDNQIYSQQEAANDQQNAAAAQAGNYQNAPENVKQVITMWVNRLASMDHFTQQQVIAQLRQDRPDLADIIVQQLQLAGGIK